MLLSRLCQKTILTVSCHYFKTRFWTTFLDPVLGLNQEFSGLGSNPEGRNSAKVARVFRVGEISRLKAESSKRAYFITRQIDAPTPKTSRTC